MGRGAVFSFFFFFKLTSLADLCNSDSVGEVCVIIEKYFKMKHANTSFQGQAWKGANQQIMDQMDKLEQGLCLVNLVLACLS